MLSIIEKIKIVIADYSSFSRLVLADILNAEVDMEVLDTVENGEELIKSVARQAPDLIIADYQLPKNSRMFTFRRIKHDYGIPILLITGDHGLGEDFIFEALKFGAYDFVKIASSTRYPQFRSIQAEITCKVRAVMDIKKEQETQGYPYMPVMKRVAATVPPAEKQNQPGAISSLIVIGASTGGTKAIGQVVQGLRPDLDAAVLIAVHLPDKFTKTFAQRLNRLTPLKVVEGKQGMRVEAGKIIIAPGDNNIKLIKNLGNKTDLRVEFCQEPAPEFDRPSVDILMKSVASIVGQRTLGVILTGMGTDGTAGVQAILNKGGDTIAQDEASSAIFGMAKSAIEKGYIAKVLDLDQISDYINRFAEYHRI